jgi:hypothetical protein
MELYEASQKIRPACIAVKYIFSRSLQKAMYSKNLEGFGAR